MSKLTAKFVENLKPVHDRVEVSDGLLAGFYLVIQPSGAKSWAVRYRSPLDGRPRKFTIGPYPAFDLGKAREAASAALRAVAEGRDPGAEKKENLAKAQEGAGGADSIGVVFDKFMSRHAKVKTREASWKEAQRIFDKEIEPRWRGRKVQSITKRDVLDLLDAVMDKGAPVLANRVLACVRKFFNWCVERDILPASPCAGVKPPADEVSRDRVLTNAEIVAFWSACHAEPFFGSLGKLLLLTAQRVDEVRELPWAELDLEGAVWHLPGSRAKNHRAHDVPLSDAALAVLEAVPRLKGSDLVLTTTGETAISGMTTAKTRIDAAMLKTLRKTNRKLESLPHWTWHDLRRTVASGLQQLGFPVEVVEAVLNHKSGTVKGVAAVYARYDYAKEKREALDAWARHVDALVSGKTANVVSLKARAV